MKILIGLSDIYNFLDKKKEDKKNKILFFLFANVKPTLFFLKKYEPITLIKYE